MIGGAVAATILTSDQLHKAWMLYGLDIMARQPIRLTPFLDVVLSWNFGVS
jgi:signal peptidase II